jgi:hypothetical protein
MASAPKKSQNCNDKKLRIAMVNFFNLKKIYWGIFIVQGDLL